MIKITILIILIVLLGLALGTLEQRSLYFPDKVIAATPDIYKLNYEEVSLQAADGTRLNGWFIPASGRPAAGQTVLLCHGNAGNISHRIDKALKLHSIGLNVLLFDYRGYGRSEGRPSEAGTYQDAEAAYQYLTHVKGLSKIKALAGCLRATSTAMAVPSDSP